MGATIEDLDIADLNRLQAQTQNVSILRVYTNLEFGSENHIRSFTSQLQRSGATYQPQYLSQAGYNAILSGSGRGR